MARWRPVDTRLWNDKTFKSLSDDGRLLWMFLLTCPSHVIPGVIISGPSGLAETLGWSSKRFAEGFAELLSKGIKVHADWSARMVWLENAIGYQPPQNPNQVKGWSELWDDIPECDLKCELWRSLKSYCARWPEPFAKGFPEPFAKPLPEPWRNQEQDQEQQQEQEEGEMRATARATPDHGETEVAEPKRKSRKRPSVPIPPDWKPNADAAKRATDAGLVLDAEAERFRDYYASKGTTFSDHDAAFRNWLRTAEKFRGRKQDIPGRDLSAQDLEDIAEGFRARGM